MGIDTTKAHDHPSTNALDHLPDDILDAPPAYYSFGQTPAPMEDPLNIDDWDIFLVRARCVGTSQSERTDGEMRHGRKLQIQWCVKKGQPEPPDPDQEQPGLFDENGEASEDEQESDNVTDIHTGVDRPGFSDGGAK